MFIGCYVVSVYCNPCFNLLKLSFFFILFKFVVIWVSALVFDKIGDMIRALYAKAPTVYFSGA